ncbi:hypothetical protein JANAI61_33330 [Jannaschia sp. AI_61]|nr:hypothetical protein JANAI61_33330 [Jannaschia sp. AI_61]
MTWCARTVRFRVVRSMGVTDFLAGYDIGDDGSDAVAWQFRQTASAAIWTKQTRSNTARPEMRPDI